MVVYNHSSSRDLDYFTGSRIYAVNLDTAVSITRSYHCHFSRSFSYFPLTVSRWVSFAFWYHFAIPLLARIYPIFSQAFAFFLAVSLQKVCGKPSVVGYSFFSSFQTQRVLRSPPSEVHTALYFSQKGLTVVFM